MNTRRMFRVLPLLTIAAMVLFFSVSMVGCTSKPSIVGHWESSLASSSGPNGMIDVDAEFMTLDIDGDNAVVLKLDGEEPISGEVTILENEPSDADDKELFDGLYQKDKFIIAINGGYLHGVLLYAPEHNEESLLMWFSNDEDDVFLLSRA